MFFVITGTAKHCSTFWTIELSYIAIAILAAMWCPCALWWWLHPDDKINITQRWSCSSDMKWFQGNAGGPTNKTTFLPSNRNRFNRSFLDFSEFITRVYDYIPWSQRLSFILYWQILRRKPLLFFYFFFYFHWHEALGAEKREPLVKIVFQDSFLVYKIQKKKANSYPTLFTVWSTVLIPKEKRKKFKDFWWLYFHNFHWTYYFMIIYTFLLHSLNILMNNSYSSSWFTYFSPNVRTKAEKACENLRYDERANEKGRTKHTMAVLSDWF